MRIAVVGSFVMDFIFETPRRPLKGESIIGRSFNTAPGGKGANQAMQAALLGAEVYMIGRIGTDIYGDQILDSLRGAGVNVDYVKRDDAGTGCSGIVLDAEGDNSIVMVPRSNMKCKPEDVVDAEEAIAEADTVLIQLEIPMKVNEKAVKLANKHNKTIIMDPAPACALEEFYYKNVSIMTPNETEAQILSGIDVVDVPSAEAAAREIAQRGLQTVIITMGGNGVLLYKDGEAKHFPPVKIEPKDSTAAGDAFTGSFSVFLGGGDPLEEAIRKASIIGAISATRLGAQPSLPDRAAFDSFVKENNLL
ncbi:MAG TPA: ribokinase [bacterium]|nr:ribokinase [bacterium]